MAAMRTKSTLKKPIRRIFFDEKTAKATDFMNPRIAKYREWAAMHGTHTLSGDSKKTNHSHDELHKVLADLIAENADSLLFALYEDDDKSVQLWTAAHTLELDENRAIAKLQELSDLSVPLVSMSARYTIEGWKEGDLRVRK